MLLGGARAADFLPRLRGRFVAFEDAVADVLAFHAGQSGEHGEHDAGGVVRALEHR